MNLHERISSAKSFDFNHFKTLQDEGDRYSYASSNLRALGEGGSRAVFLLSSKSALKISFSDRGTEQNRTEARLSQDPSSKGAVAHVQSHAPDFSWVISDLVRPVSGEQEIEQAFGMNFDQFVQIVLGQQKPQDARLVPIWSFVRSNSLHEVELMDIGHWGKAPDGRIVILDYGVEQELSHAAEGLLRGPDKSQGFHQLSSLGTSEPILEAENSRKSDVDDLRACLREFVLEVVKKCGDDWCLYTKSRKNGKRRRLGTHSSKKAAIDQEIAISYSKKRRS